MNELSLNTKQTMTSREMADLVESRHDDVKRSIERLAKSGAIQLPPMADVKNSQGQTVAIYKINKRDSYVIVAQLSPQFMAKLVDRWQELESKQQKVPTNFIEAMQLATHTLIENERLNKQIETDKQKIDFAMAVKVKFTLKANGGSIK